MKFPSIIAGLFVVAATHPATAQSAARIPALRVDPDLRVEAHTVGLAQRQGMIAVSPDGQIVVAPQGGDMILLDTLGKKLAWTVPTGWNRDLEIRYVTRLGWLSGSRWGKNTMWVADPGYGQVVLLDKDGTVTKSIENPTWVRPSWADRRKWPVFARVDVLGIYDDGSWLVVPSRERSLLATPGYDKAFSYLMRVEEGGKMQTTIARVPRNEGMFEIGTAREKRMLGIPYYPRTYYDATTDGRRVGIVTPFLSGRDSAHFRITVIGDKGDTVFSRLYPFTPVPIPTASLDSARSRIHMRIGTLTPEDIGKQLTEKMAPFYPPTAGIVLGRDRTIWVELRGTTPDERPWLVLGPTGDPIGIATVPKNVWVVEADRSHVWGLERSAQQIAAVVRLKVR